MAGSLTKQQRRSPHRIAPGVWMWSIPYDTAFFNSHLIELEKGEAVLIDPFLKDYDDEVLFDWDVFDKLPKPVAVWLTNSDHERDGVEFCRHFDIPLCVFSRERHLESRADERFDADDELTGGWRAIPLRNQKTPGECAFYHAEKQWLIVGDALLTGENGILRQPYDAPVYKDEEKAKEGLAPLADLSVKAIFVGHGEPVLHKAQTSLKNALEIDPRELAEK